MKLARKFLTVCTLLIPLSLGLAGILGKLWTLALILILPGVLCWYGQYRQQNWLVYLSLAVCIGFTTLGVIAKLSLPLMLVGLLSTFTTWHLYALIQRSDKMITPEMQAILERRHLRRLIIVNSLGFALGMAGFFIQIKVSFGAAFLLVILLALSLHNTIKRLRSENVDAQPRA